LRDRANIERIVSAVSPRPDELLLEIGAGSGEMTVPLATAGAGRILAIEPDPHLSERLRQSVAKKSLTQVEIIEDDFLSLDLPELLAARAEQRARVVGNLPYSMASPILINLLSTREQLSDMTLMFQLEVAERLIANPRTKAYGVLTVFAQQATSPEILFRIPPRAFWPRPKVQSALVRFSFRRDDEPLVGDPNTFHDVVKTLFAHRRKNISNNIKHLRSSHLGEAVLSQALSHLAIDPSRRAETLTVEEFAAVSHFCSSPR
jgi:16S rRNA (adenine1518-N6/adenine1519-N6)-dimethyltransferase